MESLIDISDDVAVKRTLDWFLEPLKPEEWARRKDDIEDYLESVVAVRPSSEEAGIPAPVSVSSDQMGWYLYLAETALTDVTKCDPIQAARILPVLRRIGTDLGRVLINEHRLSRCGDVRFTPKADILGWIAECPLSA